jgi:hypothetical protein
MLNATHMSFGASIAQLLYHVPTNGSYNKVITMF